MEISPRSTLDQVYTGVLSFLMVVILATIGYEMAGWDLMDSVYMVIITIFGVGYGEVKPVDSVWLRFFTITLIIGGTGAALYTFGAVMKIVTEGEMKKMLGELRKTKNLEELSGHAIICGYGRIGQILANELAREQFPLVILDTDSARIELAEGQGHLTHIGDATEETTLIAAGIDRASVLACVLPNDALNVFITLTARQLCPGIRILARGEQPSTEKKLLHAGANEVVLPASIGGLRIAHSITRPKSMEFLKKADSAASHQLKEIGLELRDLDLSRLTQFVGKTVDDLQNQAHGGLLVLAVKRTNGDFVEEPRSDFIFEKSDHIIAVVQPRTLPPDVLVEPVRKVRRYRGAEVAGD